MAEVTITPPAQPEASSVELLVANAVSSLDNRLTTLETAHAETANAVTALSAQHEERWQNLESLLSEVRQKLTQQAEATTEAIDTANLAASAVANTETIQAEESNVIPLAMRPAEESSPSEPVVLEEAPRKWLKIF